MALPIELALIQPSDVADFDYAGADGIISGNGKVIITSSPTADHSFLSDPGAAYFYDIIGDKHVNEQKVFPSDSKSDDRFSTHSAISYDGETAFIASAQQNSDFTHGGAVYVFKRISGIWTQTQRIVGGSGVPELNAHFGFSVSCSGDGKTLAVGEPHRNRGGTDRGNAYIFEDTGSGTYSQSAVLAASDEFDLNAAGYQVHVSRDGQNTFVGAFGLNQTGAVYAYKKGSGWSDTNEDQKIIASDAAQFDFFGTATNDVHVFGGTPITSSFDGTRLIIGAYGWEGASGAGVGAVYYYELNESTGLWIERSIISERKNSQDDSFFGYTVSLTSDGDTLIVGQQGDDVGGFNVGRVFVFKFDGASYTEEQNFQSEVLSVSSFFGYRVSIDDVGELLISTSSDYDGSGDDQGAAYLYKLDISGNPIIGNHSVDEHCTSLANYLPGGGLYKAKHSIGSNFRNLLCGMAGELFKADGHIHTFLQEIIPDNTVLFISEWEQVAGIPDDCFSGNGPISDRRRDVLVKLASSGIQTADDFVSLAALFGVSVTIKDQGIVIESVFPMTFPFSTSSEVVSLPFTIVVQFTVLSASRFPLTFPFTFGSDLIAILECLFNRLKPANCDVIFEQV